VASVSEQVALALESARLFEQTQLALGESRRLARREELINRISGKIRASVSVDDVLRIAVDELRQATGTTRAVVELNLSARAGSESRSGNGHKE
jgi:GAF domain-containing protein